jgi:putative membrane protein
MTDNAYPKINTMKKALFTLSIAAAAIMSACNNNTPPKQKESTETAEEHNEAKMEGSMENAAEFLVHVADKGMLEVELGKLAEQKGQMQEVKDFGRMMVEQHSKMNNELKALAERKNITLPTSMSEEKLDKLEKMREKSGREFDEAYIDKMEEAHEKMISAFEDKAGKEKWDADITAWMGQSLPTLRSHLAEIKRIEDKFEATKK